MQLPDDDLRRAAANVARLGEYLVARRRWTVPGDARNALRATHGAADSLRAWLCDSYPQIASARPPEIATDPLPPQPLDASRLERMAAFLDQLEVWFESRTTQEPSPDGVEILAGMAGWLHGAVAAARDVLKAHPEPRAPTPPLETPEPPPDAPERLVLEDSDAEPLLQEFKGTVELTETARGLLGGFLAGYGVELSSSSRRQLDHKVLRWLESTPDGHVLVLKMTTLHGYFEPYPVYEPRQEPGTGSPA